jgi:solute:Na+ symporter, SSS family
VPPRVATIFYVGDSYANEPDYVGLTSGLAMFVVGSLMSKPTDPEVLAEWDRRSRREAPANVPAAAAW